ncbi:MAG: class I SAM-dependent methyltransferase [Candidatus Hodarchaeota archaeon]
MTKIYDPSNFPSKMALTIIKNLKYIDDNKKIDILDIGCGEGKDDLYLAQSLKNRRIIAIDPSRKAIHKARVTLSGENDVEFHPIGFKELDENDQYDVILISGVYHFFTKIERTLFRDKIKKILKPNGWLFLSTLSSNDTQYFGKGTPVPNDPNSFNGITYLHFASKSELMEEFSFLEILKLDEFYHKNYTTDTDYHTMWMLVCRRY